MYSYIKTLSRAGLVALVFTVISISVVSAVPIPISAPQHGLSSSLSSPSNRLIHNGQDHIQYDTRRFTRAGQMSRAPTATRALAGKHALVDTYEDQLVRRTSIFTKIKHAFQKVGRKIKQGFQKAGQKIKHAFQKVGAKIKHGFQKAGQKIKHAFQKVGSKIKHGFQKAGQKIKHAFKTAGRKIKQGFQTAGRKIKHGFQVAGRKIKHGFQVAGRKIKEVAKKVGHFIKTTGAKIVKFGLKVVQSVGNVVGKIAAFIPGVGKVVDKAIAGVSKVAGVISDKIHVKLPGKLEKGMKIMNKANKIMSIIPRRRDLSEEEAFQQRDDISDVHYFEDTEDILLEHREESYFDDDYERYLDWE